MGETTRIMVCFFIVGQLMICGLLVAIPHDDPSINAQNSISEANNVIWPMDLDQNVGINGLSTPPLNEPSFSAKSLVASSELHYVIGEKASYYVGWWGKWAYNETDPSDHMVFTKRAETSTCEIWTADDLSFMPGDPRNLENEKISISDEQITQLLEAWEYQIFPKMSDLIGPPGSYSGENATAKDVGDTYFPTDNPGRIMIMVFNLADSSFWDSSYPFYGQGYFDPELLPYYDRNIIHISSYDWIDRLGPGHGNSSYQTEGILTHEYAHLLSFEYSPFQASYLSEGISEYAQVFMGYGMNDALINAYLVQPDNSLTSGDDFGLLTMADYGAAGLFVTYIGDHFGSMTVHEMIVSDQLGIKSVDAALRATGFYNWDFNRVFLNWRLANLIHSDNPGHGWYNYKSLDLSNPRYTEILVHEYSPLNEKWVSSAAETFGNSVDIDGYDTGISLLGPYGTDYIKVQGNGGSWASGLGRNMRFNFDGDDKVQGWQRQATGVMPPGWTTTSKTEIVNPWYVATVDMSKKDYCIAAGPTGKNQSEISDEWIIMDQGFNLSGKSGANLSFDIRSYPSYNDPSSYVDVLLSTDSGQHYSTVYTIDYWSWWDWKNVSVNISSAAGNEDVRLAFRFYDPSWGGDLGMFLIDNLVVRDDLGSMIWSEDFNNYVIDHWWSDSGDLVDYSLIGHADLTKVTSAELTIDTYWFIESPYDAGFIQVSTDRGKTWKSLSNEYTQTYERSDVMPLINDNMPVINAFYGGPNKWITMSFNLDEFVGHNVLYRFRYVTDAFTPYAAPDAGWSIKDIRINGVSQNPSSFLTDPPHPKDDWMITIYFPGFTSVNGRYHPPQVINLNPKERSETLSYLLTKYSMYKEMYIIVSATLGPADYGFGIGRSQLK